MEGAGQGAIGKNWGDGIATDPQIISSRGLSDPNPFFSALLQKPYIDQIIIGPHVYPPSISMAQEETSVSSLCVPTISLMAAQCFSAHAYNLQGCQTVIPSDQSGCDRQGRQAYNSSILH